MRLLSSYEHLKFDLDRVHICLNRENGIFLFKNSEIVYSFFLNLYIIKIVGRSIRIMCKNYRFMCKFLKKSFIGNFAIGLFFVNIGF